jgi:hypothetical protein
MPKERIDEVYQSNWRYNMTEYYRGFKHDGKTKGSSKLKSGIYRGVKWNETDSAENTDKKRTEGTN